MRSRRPRIPLRRRVFLGCEGESEQSYGALLARLTEDRHKRIHLDTAVLQPGAGDPLALVERAVAVLEQRSARNGPYAVRAVLIDSDTRGAVAERDVRLRNLARDHDIRIIWQTPCHEALLLRHILGCEALRPSDARQAEAELRRHWPAYRKGLPAARLASLIGVADVARAALQDSELRAFLAEIEFPDL
ncbi:RloB domain-containing protein [Methylobacterium pseudosasicola]|uniref:RloB-like protein n=1 Tax=Methylobacterium pseudosasicola TaxID=582667 RepID=A0A1I4FJA6_9HYPH|nr:RloB domain-containing protein [Methylobacterium pseudosasicola]SFL17553.1 hypothetical protein SAMN05192568_1001361 [Methylobacterium pseudosasicola]